MERNVEFFNGKPGGTYSNQWAVNGSATRHEDALSSLQDWRQQFDVALVALKPEKFPSASMR
jgi:hypothetical protein